jgi:hypothetical protein
MIPVQAIIAQVKNYMDKHQSKIGQFIGDGEQSYTVGGNADSRTILVGLQCAGRVDLFRIAH